RRHTRCLSDWSSDVCSSDLVSGGCLGNDGSKPSPGGNAALIEAPAGDSLARWDFYESSPQTTNNKMALAGAIAALEWIRRQWKRSEERRVGKETVWRRAAYE